MKIKAYMATGFGLDPQKGGDVTFFIMLLYTFNHIFASA